MGNCQCCEVECCKRNISRSDYVSAIIIISCNIIMKALGFKTLGAVAFVLACVESTHSHVTNALTSVSYLSSYVYIYIIIIYSYYQQRGI